ncbi:neurochondrin-like [Tubulanus polymorphus]|uniref:neurochondrin-like n=1 Tax=Tubulanus polymorphus TaxID=672921 RepID=UPI003DA57BE7
MTDTTDSSQSEMAQSFEYVDKCISALNTVKTDNDMFAALFMVTKLTKSSECDAATRRRIFDAIGFKFISRLLKSEKLPEGCNKNVFRSMALILLSCFATDEELSVHPHMLSQISAIGEILLTDLSDSEDVETDKQLICDCYECLTAISRHWQGRIAMIEKHTLTQLCQVYLNDCFGVADAMKLISRLVDHVDEIPIMWQLNKEICFPFVGKLAANFKQEKGLIKFQVCNTLSGVIASLQAMKDKIETEPWSSDIRQGLLDILQSRIGNEQREPTLQLLSVMIRCLGVEWINDKDVKHFILSVNLTCIEVRMILEDLSLEQIAEKQSTLTACYSILEDVITYLIGEPPICEDENQFLQVYSVIKEAMSAVIYYLKQVSTTAEQKQIESYSRLTQASIRVLCSWLAVETNALKTDVCDVLPFILHQSDESCRKLSGFPGNDDEIRPIVDDVDLFRFVVPILCHLTAENESRHIIIEQNAHQLLGLYFLYQWKLFLKNQSVNATLAQESEGVLICICGIFMNFAVLEPQLVATDSVFDEMLKFILANFSNLAGNTDLMVLTCNALVLGLMFLRIQQQQTLQQSGLDSVNAFFTAAISFLKNIHHFTDKGIELVDTFTTYWFEIGVSGLYYIAVQELCQMMESQKFNRLVDIVYQSNWPRQIITMLSKAKDQAISVEKDQLSLYESILSTCLPLCSDLQKSNDQISTIANSFEMMKLSAALR